MIKILIAGMEWPYPEHRNGVSKILANLLVDNPYYEADFVYFCEKPSRVDVPFNVTYSELDSKASGQSSKSLRSYFSVYPFAVNKYRKYLNFSKVADLLISKESNYDVLLLVGAQFSFVSSFLSGDILRKTVIAPIDSLGLHFFRRMRRVGVSLLSPIYFLELVKCIFFEKRWYRRFSATLFVSEIDVGWVKYWNKSINACSIPNGVDIDYFSPVVRVDSKFNMVFSGNMDYAPNCDAAIFAGREIVNELAGDWYSLYLVGSNPSRHILEMAAPNVFVTGFVPDMRDYLAKASIYISPLREGSGIKNKVLEAMSMGKVVIGTPISFEGIDVKDGVNCIIVSCNAKAFSEAIVKARNGEFDLLAIGQRARSLMEQSYSWAAIRKKYANFLQSVIGIDSVDGEN